MDLERAAIKVVTGDQHAFVASLIVQPALIDEIKHAQKKDSGLVRLVEEVEKVNKSELSFSEDGILRFKSRLCMLNNEEIKRIILEEAHCSLDTVHPGSRKMYRDLRVFFVERYEKGNCQICRTMPNMPTGESGTYETSKVIATTPDSIMEVGAYFCRLCYRTTTDTDWSRCNMGDSGPLDEDRSLCAYQNFL
ncbi:hypothetical protein F2P56_001858 [Juglans regia]|uniref:Uncharacterized protein LOC109003790 n=2 Tax=Juglans regia TaxID=51240 RepID=A0A2I4G157_JUGRE|nr:uncharacterized protein LOC109003790 [Juglans regia]KAF5481188.1 hypothetical protein F2P56_001858 [Juglans regia]